MAAPVPTVRQTPAGIKMEDGYKTVVTFAADPDVSLWEITVKPPGVDGGDMIDTFTMHTTTWRTKSPRQLKTMTEGSFTFAYDPAVLSQLVALINVKTTVTVTFPDGTTWALYGCLRVAEFDDMEEGTMPTGTGTIEPTNFDPTNKVETGPAIASVAGT